MGFKWRQSALEWRQSALPQEAPLKRDRSDPSREIGARLSTASHHNEPPRHISRQLKGCHHPRGDHPVSVKLDVCLVVRVSLQKGLDLGTIRGAELARVVAAPGLVVNSPERDRGKDVAQRLHSAVQRPEPSIGLFGGVIRMGYHHLELPRSCVGLHKVGALGVVESRDIAVAGEELPYFKPFSHLAQLGRELGAGAGFDAPWCLPGSPRIPRSRRRL